VFRRPRADADAGPPMKHNLKQCKHLSSAVRIGWEFESASATANVHDLPSGKVLKSISKNSYAADARLRSAGLDSQTLPAAPSPIALVEIWGRFVGDHVVEASPATARPYNSVR